MAYVANVWRWVPGAKIRKQMLDSSPKAVTLVNVGADSESEDSEEEDPAQSGDPHVRVNRPAMVGSMRRQHPLVY